MTKEKERTGLSAALMVNLAAFALGALAGFILAGALFRWGVLSLDGWIRSYVLGLSIRGAEDVPFLSVLWDTVKWPAFVWALGYTAMGTWMVPVMFALRGWSLCFCVAGLSGAAGGGFLLALTLFSLGGAVVLPVFFLLGTAGWNRALALRRRTDFPVESAGKYIFRSLPALGLTIACAGLEYWLVPVLLPRLLPLLDAAGRS